ATQNVVEKMLKSEKKSRYDLGREQFLERMWQWRRESGDTILMQLRRLGCSLDWSRTRFTMDEVCSQAVYRAFQEFYKKGWIYRGKRMVNWCVRCRTALSDIEVEYEERKDKLYHLRYPILSGVRDGWQGVPLVVATTRPETMLGDTAVAVHPDDKRYEKIHGWWVQLPLLNREIAIVSDEAVDPKFGTGVVKVTPAHDPTDFEIGERHHLSQEIVIGFDGKMTDKAGSYAGLSREECRKKVVEDLRAQDLIEKIEDYTHSVGVCYRCGVVVEPLVSDQWFLKVGEMAQKARAKTLDGSVKIFPETWEKPYILWLENLKDWCVSRQIWWGHRIPVWYCRSRNVGDATVHPSLATDCPPIVSSEKVEQCPDCGKKQMEQDPDVLDTWFSSGLWPFSVFGWPQKTEDLKRFYPTSVLVTGHEILYLWVARMVMMGLELMGEIPFSHVFIHGIVRDKQGKKMSKSLGNVMDPLTMMDRFGTDALRFVLTQNSVPGRDMQIAEDSFVGARNFANKIWNVSRFVLMNLQTSPVTSGRLEKSSLELCDRWILSRFQKAAREVQDSLNSYNLSQASRTLYQFVWSEFCDWYVEISKIRLLSQDPEKKNAALCVLVHILDGILRALHPVMPFITEEIWQMLQGTSNKGDLVPTLLYSSFPMPDENWLDPQAEKDMSLLMEIIVQVRTIRSEMNVSPAKKIRIEFNCSDTSQKALLQNYQDYIQHLCKGEDLQVGSGIRKSQKSAAAIVQGIEIFVPLEGLIDFEKEKLRLTRDLESAQKELKILEERLSQPLFKQNAPAEEVQKTLLRKEESLKKSEKLKEHLLLMENR
ncbi:MAG: valine--tRNA ligase, partial [Elusimicrobia bacterium]|nr:valine--tRNA ligase [Elusimicrobiota bacterium]